MRLPFADPMHLPPAGETASARLAHAFFSWRTLGIVLVAMMLARWVWVFAAPPDVAMPATVSWQKSEATADMFGHMAEVDANAAVAASNIKLVGLFAHSKAGFAVLMIDGKQVGAGLGETLPGGLRLVETRPNYVLLERGGVKQRVDLQTSSASSGITPAAIRDENIVRPAAPVAIPNHTNLESIPPEQRAVMQQELDNFRRRH